MLVLNLIWKQFNSGTEPWAPSRKENFKVPGNCYLDEMSVCKTLSYFAAIYPFVSFQEKANKYSRGEEGEGQCCIQNPCWNSETLTFFSDNKFLRHINVASREKKRKILFYFVLWVIHSYKSNNLMPCISVKYISIHFLNIIIKSMTMCQCTEFFRVPVSKCLTMHKNYM